LVRSNAYGPASEDLVVLSYLILEGEVEVGEGLQEGEDKLLGAFSEPWMS